jgi:drug/metabolite transporter (DMT)-like permease
MSRLWHTVLLLVMGTAWGLQFSMLKLAATGDISEIEILTVAMLVIAIVFSLICRARGGGYAITRERAVFLIITAALGYTVPLGAALVAAPYVPAGIITFIVSLTPVVTVVCALAARVEQVSALRMAAIALGMVAAGIIIVPEMSLPAMGMVPWLAVAAIVPLCYGVETAYVAARWPKGLDVVQVVAGEAVVAFVMMVPLYLVYGEPSRLANLWSEAGIGVAGFVAAGLVEVLLYFYLVQKAGAVFTSFATFISLFAGIGWGMALFAETHGAGTWLAVALLVAALAIIVHEGRQAEAAQS